MSMGIALANVGPASPSVTFGVSFFCWVPGVLPLHKRRGILLRPGAFQGAFQENDTCFPLFCCVCDLGTSVTFAWVQGEVPRELPSAREIPKQKNDTLKMRLGRARTNAGDQGNSVRAARPQNESAPEKKFKSIRKMV